MTPPQKTIRGDAVRPGTIIMFLGTPHLVDHIRPYDYLGAIGIAKAADGWGITLFANDRVEVA